MAIMRYAEGDNWPTVDADNANKLGGQPPSYYAKASDVNIGTQLAALLGKVSLSGKDGDLVVSASTTLPDTIYAYKNLTVNNGVTLNFSSKQLIIITVSDTLTLNGIISVDANGGAGGAGGQPTSGQGGNGGGAILIIANKIVGTGTVRANGLNAVAASSAGTDNGVVDAGKPGSDGRFLGKIPTGAQTSGSSPNPGISNFNVDLVNLFFYNLFSLDGQDVGGAGGAGGQCDNSTTSGNGGVAGNGGAGVVGNGGRSGSWTGSSSSRVGNGGGGGGGGGAILLFSINNVPAIKLDAKGGNGSTGAGTNYAGGGGGGGGLVAIAAPASTAIVTVTGGTGGANGPGLSTAAQPGGAGLSLFYKTS